VSGDESTDSDGGVSSAGARDSGETTLPTAYVEHMWNVTESHYLCDDAARLLDTNSSGHQ